MEALGRIRIPGEARQVFDVIIRKTWGWHKKEDAIALSQFCLATGLSKSKVIKARKKLLEMNLIIVSQKGNDDSYIYRLNKDFETWKPLPKRGTLISQKGNDQPTKYNKDNGLEDSNSFPKRETEPELFPKKETTVPQKGNESLPKRGPTKDTVTKDILTKEDVVAKEVQLSELIASFSEKTRPLIHEYLDLLAAENKTGRVMVSRRIREVEELHEVLTGSDPPTFQQALKAACDNQAPNVNYVKKVLKNMGKKKWNQSQGENDANSKFTGFENKTYGTSW